jgi:hypothetical protein
LGGQIGYNWQVNSIVYGIESDIQWTDVKSSVSVALLNTGIGFVPFNGTASSKLDWYGTTRGRLGFLVQPNVLFYGTAGVWHTALSRAPGTPPLLRRRTRLSTARLAIPWLAGQRVRAWNGRSIETGSLASSTSIWSSTHRHSVQQDLAARAVQPQTVTSTSALAPSRPTRCAPGRAMNSADRSSLNTDPDQDRRLNKGSHGLGFFWLSFAPRRSAIRPFATRDDCRTRDGACR